MSVRRSKGAYAEEIRVAVRDILPTITVYRFPFRNQEEVQKKCVVTKMYKMYPKR